MKVLRKMCAVAMLTVFMLVAALFVREWAYDHWSPYLVDYNAPGMDITSEGP